MKDSYYSASLKVSVFSISVNLSLAILQAVLASFAKSISLFADALDSLRDILSSLVVILSLYFSKKPPDKTHPFGHGRIEDISGLALSSFLIWMGWFFLKESSLRLFYPVALRINYYIIFSIFIFAGVKLILGWAAQRVFIKHHVFLMRLEAFHHYTDFLTTFVVGLGLLISKRLSYPYIDALLGIGISLVIIFWALMRFKDFIDNLIGKEAPSGLYARIESICRDFKGVEGIHDIEVHTYGRKRIITLHIEMEPGLSLEETHRVADSIEKKIYQEGLGRCVVHVDLKKKSANF